MLTTESALSPTMYKPCTTRHRIVVLYQDGAFVLRIGSRQYICSTLGDAEAKLDGVFGASNVWLSRLTTHVLGAHMKAVYTCCIHQDDGTTRYTKATITDAILAK